MARLGPSDQVAKIEALLDQRIKAGTLKAGDYEQTRRNLLQTLSHDNVASSGTTYHESLSMTDATQAKKYAHEIKLKSATLDMHQSGIESGISGATFGGVRASAIGIYDLAQGNKNVGEVITDITVNTAKGFATGYAVTAMSKGVTHTSSHFLGQTVAKSLTASNAPVAIASGIVESAKSITAYLRGDISSEEMLDQINHTAITSTAMFYYGALGQTVIPIPVVGAVIGSTVGYFVATILYHSPLIALGDSMAVKMARQRRQEIESMCLTAISKIREERQLFETQIKQYFEYSYALYQDVFDTLDISLTQDNPDQFLSGLEKLNHHFGKTLQFRNFEEFDQLMRSDMAIKF